MKFTTKLITASALAGLALTGVSQGFVVATYATDWTSESQTNLTLGTQTFGNGTTTFGTQAIATTDYTGGGDYPFVNVTATHGVTGQWLIAPSASGDNSQTATITLTGVPAFTSVSIDQLFIAAGGGLARSSDIEVIINGVSILDDSFVARDREGSLVEYHLSYGQDAPAAAVLEAAFDEAPTGDHNNTSLVGSEFLSGRTGGWGHDALYDVGQDSAFDDIALVGGGNVTIQIIGGQIDNHADETQAIGNLGISFNGIPEPSTALLVGLAGLGLLRRRRA